MCRGRYCRQCSNRINPPSKGRTVSESTRLRTSQKLLGNVPWNKGVKTGKHSHNWNGGISVSSGYVSIYMPDHPRADMRGYVREHVLLCEKALGKPLPPYSEPHHVDLSRDNNHPSNLVLCQNRRYHMMLHIRTKALHECGNADWRRCSICKQYDDQNNLIYRKRNPRYGDSWHHNECRKIYRKLGSSGFQCKELPFEY
jgi:hypothetical protein